MGSASVTAWGVRGSYPRADRDFLEYGGNTACFSLDWSGPPVIFDAGTGIEALGRRMEERREAHLLISHPHLDHIQGLVSFAPLLRPDFTLHIYGEGPLKGRLEGLMGPPYWPVTLSGYKAKVIFHELSPGDGFSLPGGGLVRTIRSDHPGGSLIYRVDADGRRVVYTLDCEGGCEVFAALTEFARDADLLIWDAAFKKADLRPGWGHSTAERGAELKRAAGVRRVLLAHYSTDYDDDAMREREAGMGDEDVIYSKEGMVMEL